MSSSMSISSEFEIQNRKVFKNAVEEVERMYEDITEAIQEKACFQIIRGDFSAK